MTEKSACLKYTLNACKLGLEENIFDFYVEPILSKVRSKTKILIKILTKILTKVTVF